MISHSGKEHEEENRGLDVLASVAQLQDEELPDEAAPQQRKRLRPSPYEPLEQATIEELKKSEGLTERGAQKLKKGDKRCRAGKFYCALFEPKMGSFRMANPIDTAHAEDLIMLWAHLTGREPELRVSEFRFKPEVYKEDKELVQKLGTIGNKDGDLEAFIKARYGAGRQPKRGAESQVDGEEASQAPRNEASKRQKLNDGFTGRLASEKTAAHYRNLFKVNEALDEARTLAEARALHEAAAEGQTLAVIELLKAVDANAVRKGVPLRMSPLHTAVAARDGVPLDKSLKIVRTLIFNNPIGANVDCKDSKGRTPLYYATRRGKHEMMSELIERKASPTVAAINGATPIHVAAENNDIKALNILWPAVDEDESAPPSDILNAVQSASCGTPLHWAARCAGRAVLEHLMSHGCRAGDLDFSGATALHVAARHGNKSAIRFLLSQQADVDARDNDGRLTKHLAAAKGHENCLDALGKESYKKDDGRVDGKGWTPLMLAIAGGHLKSVRYFSTASELHKGTSGWTPLHMAVAYGRINIAEHLIEEGADILAETASGRTPLSLAATRHDQEMKTSLLKALETRLQVDKDVGGNVITSLLERAVKRGRDLEVECLLEVRAIYESSLAVSNALYLATRCGHAAVVYALAKSAALHSTDVALDVVLNVAAEAQQADVCRVLLHMGASINSLTPRAKENLELKNDLGLRPFSFSFSLQQDDAEPARLLGADSAEVEMIVAARNLGWRVQTMERDASVLPSSNQREVSVQGLQECTRFGVPGFEPTEDDVHRMLTAMEHLPDADDSPGVMTWNDWYEAVQSWMWAAGRMPRPWEDSCFVRILSGKAVPDGMEELEVAFDSRNELEKLEKEKKKIEELEKEKKKIEKESQRASERLRSVQHQHSAAAAGPSGDDGIGKGANRHENDFEGDDAPPNPALDLGLWCRLQQTMKERLSLQQRELLEALPGWQWRGPSEEFMTKATAFLRLKAFMSIQKGRFPGRYDRYLGFPLGRWVYAMATAKAVGRLSLECCEVMSKYTEWQKLVEERQQHLEFEARSNTLRDYVCRCGHLPRNTGDEPLFRWLQLQQRRWHDGTLAEHEGEALAAIPGFLASIDLEDLVSSKPRRRSFDDMLHLLQEFRKAHHGNLPKMNTIFQGVPLGVWCSTQRRKLRDQKLAKQEEQALIAILNAEADGGAALQREGHAGVQIEATKRPEPVQVHSGLLTLKDPSIPQHVLGIVARATRGFGLKPKEVLQLLDAARNQELKVGNGPLDKPMPEHGALYVLSKASRYKSDGHVWSKETHSNLKVDKEERIKCYYAQATDVTSSQGLPLNRRCYWDKNHGDIVLVHYLFYAGRSINSQQMDDGSQQQQLSSKSQQQHVPLVSDSQEHATLPEFELATANRIPERCGNADEGAAQLVDRSGIGIQGTSSPTSLDITPTLDEAIPRSVKKRPQQQQQRDEFHGCVTDAKHVDDEDDHELKRRRTGAGGGDAVGPSNAPVSAVNAAVPNPDENRQTIERTWLLARCGLTVQGRWYPPTKDEEQRFWHDGNFLRSGSAFEKLSEQHQKTNQYKISVEVQDVNGKWHKLGKYCKDNGIELTKRPRAKDDVHTESLEEYTAKIRRDVTSWLLSVGWGTEAEIEDLLSDGDRFFVKPRTTNGKPYWGLWYFKGATTSKRRARSQNDIMRHWKLIQKVQNGDVPTSDKRKGERLAEPSHENDGEESSESEEEDVGGRAGTSGSQPLQRPDKREETVVRPAGASKVVPAADAAQQVWDDDDHCMHSFESLDEQQQQQQQPPQSQTGTLAPMEVGVAVVEERHNKDQRHDGFPASRNFQEKIRCEPPVATVQDQEFETRAAVAEPMQPTEAEHGTILGFQMPTHTQADDPENPLEASKTAHIDEEKAMATARAAGARSATNGDLAKDQMPIPARLQQALMLHEYAEQHGGMFPAKSATHPDHPEWKWGKWVNKLLATYLADMLDSAVKEFMEGSEHWRLRIEKRRAKQEKKKDQVPIPARLEQARMLHEYAEQHGGEFPATTATNPDHPEWKWGWWVSGLLDAYIKDNLSDEEKKSMDGSKHWMRALSRIMLKEASMDDSMSIGRALRSLHRAGCGGDSMQWFAMQALPSKDGWSREDVWFHFEAVREYVLAGDLLAAEKYVERLEKKEELKERQL